MIMKITHHCFHVPFQPTKHSWDGYVRYIKVLISFYFSQPTGLWSVRSRQEEMRVLMDHQLCGPCNWDWERHYSTALVDTQRGTWSQHWTVVTALDRGHSTGQRSQHWTDWSQDWIEVTTLDRLVTRLDKISKRSQHWILVTMLDRGHNTGQRSPDWTEVTTLDTSGRWNGIERFISRLYVLWKRSLVTTTVTWSFRVW
jgi:hypothetical protein